MDTLLEAAAQMFTRRGLAATTNHIAERAGLSIGTLYQYFPNKEALLHALAARHLAEAQARLMPLLAELRRSAPEFEETVRQVLEVVVDLHRDRPALHALLHRVAPRSPREVAALRAFEDRLVEEFAFHLRRCGRGGEDPVYTARTVVHLVDAHLHRVSTAYRVDVERLTVLVRQLTG
ncbi:TetR/AcrR family transcriptional regulator [Nocardia farcinica]|uniref:TetR/AcrR family transcriptional regulator n=1 Tax=Nocardia farcinica TaxID=37329 RepID=UPI00397EAA21